MDRNEFSLRVEALKAAMHQHDYEKAIEIADDLDLRKIKDNNLLSMVADAYEYSHDYERSKDALLTAYENTNAGRQLAYRLCLISIKTKEYDEAKEFYEDFVEMAPRDTGRYILKYKMAKAQGAPLEKQIKILEEYVNIDMEEKWAYELTKLYDLAGDQEKCVDMCDEISLWFSEGKYVLKALDLKKKYVPLSAAQKQKYEEGKQKALEEAAKEEVGMLPQDDDVIQIYPEEEEQNDSEEIEFVDEEAVEEVVETPQNIELSKFDTMDIQAVIAEGMKEVDLDGTNIHEDEGSTKVAEGKIPFTEIEKPKESDQAFKPAASLDLNIDDIVDEEVEETKPTISGDVVEIKMEEPETVEEEPETEETTEEAVEEPAEETAVEEPEETPVIESLGDVQDILKKLQERGILKAETVEQAVTIIEEAGNEENKELDEEFAKIDQGLDEVIFNESEEELEDGADEEFNERISSTQKILLKEQGALKEEPEEEEFTEADEFSEEETSEEETSEEEIEEVSEEPEIEEENEEEEEPVVSKETIAIPNLQAIRKDLQTEKSEAEETQEEEPETEEPEAEEPEEVTPEEETVSAKAETLNNIPVLDLTFEMPKRDTSNDVGKEELYESIVANSDLGNITDKIPSKEEIEKAIREAEEQDQIDDHEGLRATASLSAAVEVISGTNWSQNGEEELPEIDLSDEVQEEPVAEAEQEETVAEPEENIEEPVEEPIEETVEEVAEEPEVEEEEVSEEQEEESEEEPVEDENEEEAEETETEEEETEGTTEEVADEETAEAEEEESVDDEEAEEESEEESEEELTEETAKGPGVKLTDEEMEVFQHYLNVEGLEESIRTTAEDLISGYSPDGKSTEGNVIILGNKKTGKTTLAIELIKLVNAKRGRRNRKLAKVNAVALNKRGFRNSLNKLIGCDLVVEHAHELGVMTISEIIDCAGMFTDDMLMVLEGDTAGMESLLENTPRIKEVFDHVIHIREYNIKEWVEYGKRYAEEKGYVMDELASLAFYKAIDDCFGTHKGIKQEHVEGILDEAIARRSRKLFGAKKNEDGLTILIEKNFR